ncbi:MAG: tetratricopeptide repeat protein, partial [Bryobacteraceae bacterium]|nr:tetratricopeptide repeat protein [Bryobacteraceae bacterium]
MSASVITPAGITAENELELQAVCRMMERAQSCVLAFAWVNHPALRERLTAEVRRRIHTGTVVEVTMNPQADFGFVEQWEIALGGQRPAALFVYGLEKMLDLTAGYTHSMAVLNLNRGYLAQRFPFPIIFWAPDFAMVEFSRQAPDTWSAKSGSFHFTGGSAETAETLRRLDDANFWSSDQRDKLERQELLERVLRELEAEESPDPQAAADARMKLAQGLSFGGQQDRAKSLYQQALTLYQQIGARLGEANCRKALGDVALMQARYADAFDLYQQALPLYQQIGDRLGEANCRKALGDVAGMQDRYADAFDLYQQALPLYQQIGDRLGEANCRKSLGDVARMQARYADAFDLYQQALPLYQQIGARLGEANCRKALGDVARMQARYADAFDLYQQALPLYQQIGDRLGEANCGKALGDVALRQARYADAFDLYQQALPLYQQIGDRLGE